MFCSHCGEKLIKGEQQFCQGCGTEIFTDFKPTDYKPENIQSAPTPKVVYVPVKPYTQLQRGPPGKSSKLCLSLALGSVFIGILSLIIGYNFFRFFNFSHITVLGQSIVVIVILLLRIGGYGGFF